MKNLLPILGISLFLFSCGTNNDKDRNTQSESTIVEEKVSNCVFSYNNDATGIFWKAYKHTNKVGVNGRFDVFDVSFAEESNTIEGLLEGLKLSVDVQSVNSNDTLRDGKIRRHFFGSMLNTNMITGEIIAVNGSTGKIGRAHV